MVQPRLVNVAERDAEAAEQLERFGAVPARVAHLGDQRILLEGVRQPLQVRGILGGAPERPRELHQQTAELAGVDQRLQAFAVSLDRGPVEVLVMREASVELGGEVEIGESAQLLRPHLRQLRPQRVVERTVDFNDRKIISQILCFMKALWTIRRVDHPVPIAVRPARGPNLHVV